jgi:hypothetical protein
MTDLKEEIVLRCHYEMGEFGVEAVRGCIETENAALGALSAYPMPARPIISRCAGQLRGNGWEVIKLCVDKDLEAEAALAGSRLAASGSLVQTRRDFMGRDDSGARAS